MAGGERRLGNGQVPARTPEATSDQLEAIVEREATKFWRRAERAHKAKASKPSKGGRSDPVIELADPANSRLSFSNLTEAHDLDALRRQYQVELPQIRRAVSCLCEHFRSPHPLVHHQTLTDGKHLFVEAAGLKDVINASRHGHSRCAI